MISESIAWTSARWFSLKCTFSNLQTYVRKHVLKLPHVAPRCGWNSFCLIHRGEYLGFLDSTAMFDPKTYTFGYYLDFAVHGQRRLLGYFDPFKLLYTINTHKIKFRVTKLGRRNPASTNYSRNPCDSSQTNLLVAGHGA